MGKGEAGGLPASMTERRLDPWPALRRATPARVGLGRTGDAMPLRPVLDLQLAHARARDAVHEALDVAALSGALTSALAPHRIVSVRSAAPDRATYLKRPDLGRALDPACRADLARDVGAPPDCVFVLADGLSAAAVTRHAPALLAACLPLLGGLRMAPLVIATQARVALGDAIGEALGARLCVVLIGERPGLSAADSLGAYVTYDPRVGRLDAERNCVSNIHGAGLGIGEAARQLAWLIREGLVRRVTGIALKADDPVAGTLARPG